MLNSLTMDFRGIPEFDSDTEARLVLRKKTALSLKQPQIRQFDGQCFGHILAFEIARVGRRVFGFR